MKYIVVHIGLSNREEYVKDLLCASLGEIEFESFTETGEGIDAFILSEKYNDKELKRVLTHFEYDKNTDYRTEETEDKNWNEEWEKFFFEPIVIDNECVIHSSFHEDIPACTYDIVIDPKMSFGTGHHETTSLMISEILKMNLRHKKVLDMGCGTSVLAILASKKGADDITAVDIDDWCVRNSEENILLNGAKNIHIVHGGAETLEGRKFDIVIANINRNILLQDLPAYTDTLTGNGEIYISGFYTEDIPVLEKRAKECGLQPVKTTNKNNWAMVQFISRLSKS